MTDTMTPSEIADWLDIEANTLGHIPMLAWDAPYIRQAAATIRAQAEALRIATEALEALKSEAEAWDVMGCSDCDLIVESFNGYEGRLSVGDLRRASAALARIKEVGA